MPNSNSTLLSEHPIHLYGKQGLEGQLRDAFNIIDHKDHIKAVRSILADQMSVIREGNRNRGSGAVTVRYISDMVDTLIRVFFDNLEIRCNPTDKIVALVAVGGYGKMEQCPKSDIDLLILTTEKITTSEQTQAETIIRNLWDYGFEVGASVRSVSQCETAIAKDLETYTSFLSERFLGGNWDLYSEFLRVLEKPIMPWKTNSLINFKLEERHKRLTKYGGLVQHLEPNIKEGIGGLRDVHTIMWIARLKFSARNFSDLMRLGLLTPQEHDDMYSAYSYILQARCCLHFLINKKDDMLYFHMQPEVATEFGFVDSEGRSAVELFMQFYYYHIKAINRITEAFLSRWEERPKRSRIQAVPPKHPYFRESNGTLEMYVQVGNPFRSQPKLMLEYFDLANRSKLAFGNFALHRLRQAVRTSTYTSKERSEHISDFLKLCRRTDYVGRMLRAMHDVGLVELLIPDFKIVHCHTQHNIYHIYTTDEHTLTVVRQLAYLPRTTDEPLESLREALEAVDDIEVLQLACFFHDIGKGIPGDHSITGSEMIVKYMQSVGYTESQCREGEILVRHHLAMNEIAQRRNLEDPKVIKDFIAKVEQPSTLHKLYVLTYCDVSSVHSDAWSGWKAALLRILYYKTLDEMKRPLQPYMRAVDMQDGLIEAASKTIAREKVTEHIRNMPKQYSSIATVDQVCLHVEMFNELLKKRIVIRHKDSATYCDITLCAPDHPQLLLAISCATAQTSSSILSARFFTRMDGAVLCEISVQYSGTSTPNWGTIIEKFTSQVQLNLKASIDDLYMAFKAIRVPRDRIQTKEALHVPVGVDFSNNISANYSTIDISCADRIGLVFQVLKVFFDLKLVVHGAILTTEASVALDSFYVTTLSNRKLQNAQKVQQLKFYLEKELLGRAIPEKVLILNEKENSNDNNPTEDSEEYSQGI